MAERIDTRALAGRLQEHAGPGRFIVAIAGAPGSGKSTLSDDLVERLNRDRPGRAAVMPMDGFHYDDLVLVPRGMRPRKGAPDTFDVGGFGHLLGRLRANTEAEVAVPVFDRDLEIARAGARLIPQSVSVLVVEGLYLLLRSGRWSALRPMFDLTVMVDTPEPVLRQRLTDRWVGYGLTPDEVAWKVDGNDLPNGRFVRAESSEPDFYLDA